MQAKKITFVGRYGEVLQNVKKVWKYLARTYPYNQYPRTLYTAPGINELYTATGMDENGNPHEVFFEVSKETMKKNGEYCIRRTSQEHPDKIDLLDALKGNDTYNANEIEVCYYKNDKLHGDDIYYGLDGYETKRLFYIHGKKSDVSYKDKVQNVKSLRHLFSDKSVQEAIGRENLLKVKTTMTKAMIKEKE